MGDGAEIPPVLNLNDTRLKLHGEVAGKCEGGKHGGIYDRNLLLHD
jgi:hypothetical protein